MFRKRNCYDIDYLLESDLKDARPTMEKLVRMTPYFNKDKAVAYSIFALQDASEEVKDYYKKKAQEQFIQDNYKYNHLLEIMETKVYE
jgi:hypothetical protein